MHQELDRILCGKKTILDSVRRIMNKKIAAQKIRIQGDLYLGQILYTGKDFIFIDFEGEPARTISERRLKYSPLKDVVGMIQSFHYAAYGCICQRMLKQGIEAENPLSLGGFVVFYRQRCFLVPLSTDLAADLTNIAMFWLEKYHSDACEFGGSDQGNMG